MAHAEAVAMRCEFVQWVVGLLLLLTPPSFFGAHSATTTCAVFARSPARPLTRSLTCSTSNTPAGVWWLDGVLHVRACVCEELPG